jgi:hypothetical protein
VVSIRARVRQLARESEGRAVWALAELSRRRGVGHTPGCLCQTRTDGDDPRTALPCRELRRIVVAGGLGREIWGS